MILLVLAPAGPAWSEQSPFHDRVGDGYEIKLESATKSSGGGSSGNSFDRNTLAERVVAVRPEGIELEFDLPQQTSADDRARSWQFPARVFKAPGRPLQLLNEPEIDARLDAWLQSGGMSKAACGRWVFTWTAIKIECDPKSVLETLQRFDLRRDDLVAGAPLQEPGALGASPLRVQARPDGGMTFTTEGDMDPDLVRRERAAADVVVAEIMGQQRLSQEAVLGAWADKRISGTFVSIYELAPDGRVARRSRVTELEIAEADGSVERSTTTETTDRRLVARGDGP